MPACGALENGQQCPHPGRWRPVLLVRVHLRHPPARAEIGIAMCDEHKLKRNKLDDWVTDDGWKKISDGLAAVGRAKPRRELTTVDWEPVS